MVRTKEDLMYFGKIACALTAIATVLLSQPANAADWPRRPVTIVVPLGAGGNTDMMARLGAQRLSEKFGQPFVVENRPSAGGALGTGQVAAAAPDGYTILFSPSSMLLLTPMVQKVPFDADKQLVPVVNVGTGTQMIAIRRSLPVKTLGEFIAHAKANPGKLNFVIAGANNIAHLAPVLLFARAGVDVVMIPAKSGPQAVQDLMAGQVDFYFGNTSELLPHADSDKVRLIAVGTPQRIPVAPDSSSRRGTASRFRPGRRRRSSRRSTPRSPRSRSPTQCASASPSWGSCRAA
jgi:tripartite-type tricarboxylate transporter receptor subunit TctC